MSSQHRIDKLPKWAQQEIAHLRMRNEELQGTLAEEWSSDLKEDRPRIEIGYGLGVDKPPRLIRLKERVMFYVGSRLGQAFDVRWDEEDQHLIVQGHDSIVIAPRAANSVNVSLCR